MTMFRSLALGAVLVVPLAALSADKSPQALMKERHHHYHELGDAFKTVRDQSRAGTPDMAAIKSAAQVINDASIDQGKWFPAGTGPEAGKTRALPEIWKRPDDFKAAQKMFSAAAPKLLAAASSGDAGAVKTQFGEVGKTCKNCHDTFRSPEDHD
jgi:cytochrome c556